MKNGDVPWWIMAESHGEHWKVIKTETGEEVKPDDVITDIHGGKARYRRLLIAPENGRQPLVEVFCPNEGCPSERYAYVFGLRVIACDGSLCSS